MSEFKPERMVLKNIIDADDYKQRVRTKLMRFYEENPEMEQYIEWQKSQKLGLGILIGFLFTAACLLLVAEGYMLAIL